MAQDHVGHGLTRQMALWPEQEAPVRIERAKNEGLCPDKAAGQQTDREQESTQARAAHAAAGLPALTGTLKQVAWAETIRAKALASPSNQVPRCATASGTGKLAAKAATGELGFDEPVTRSEQALEVAAAARRELEMQTSARWWIEQRDQVDDHVHRAHAAARHASPDLCARPDAGKEATAKASRQAPARQQNRIAAQAEMVAHTMTFVVGDQPVSVVVYRSRAEHQKRLAAQAESVAQATTFMVGDHPGAVFVYGGSIRIQSRDGRTAHGQVDGDQWRVFQIGHNLLDCTHPEAVRIAREAHAHHGAKAPAVVGGSIPSLPPSRHGASIREVGTATSTPSGVSQCGR
jgi:hypothetical protein